MQAMPAIKPRIVSLIVIRSEFSRVRVSSRSFLPRSCPHHWHFRSPKQYGVGWTSNGV
jgi:hypothetical protein